MAKNGKSKSELVAGRASGMTVKASAQLAGISERTAYRRLAEAQTAQEIASLAEELGQITFQQILGMRKRALEVVSESLESGDVETRIKLARWIIELSHRLYERHVLLPEVHRLRDLLVEGSIQIGRDSSG